MLVHQIIQYYARSFPDTLMLRDDSCHYSFVEGQALVNQIANLLIAQGLAAGDRVAVVGENSAEHLLLLLAATQTGLVLVPVNYRLAVPELIYIFTDAEIKLALTTDVASWEKTLQVAAELNDLTVFSTETGLPDTQSWKQSLLKQSSEFTPTSDSLVSENASLLQLYTSGTTGRPKGVLLSQKNLFVLSANANSAALNRLAIGSRELVIAPLFHVGGLCSATNALLSGSGVVLHKSFDPQAVANALEQDHINAVFLVPAMIQALLHGVEDIESRRFSHLQRIVYGAAPISESLLRRAIKVFDCEFIQLFGMTETCGGALSLTWADHQRALNGRPELLRSCGRGLADVSVKIVDPDGKQVSVGETGEIIILSGSNMEAYWNLPEATAKTLVDGWVYTGDAAYEDAEGYFYLRDRLKDMVISGGENIYPVEVENVLNAHPAILELAVIGVPDEQYGEALLAIVVLHNTKQLSLDEIITFGREKLAGYKVPRQLVFMDALPRNPSGKILKTVLRAPYWQD